MFRKSFYSTTRKEVVSVKSDLDSDSQHFSLKNKEHFWTENKEIIFPIRTCHKGRNFDEDILREEISLWNRLIRLNSRKFLPRMKYLCWKLHLLSFTERLKSIYNSREINIFCIICKNWFREIHNFGPLTRENYFRENFFTQKFLPLR